MYIGTVRTCAAGNKFPFSFRASGSALHLTVAHGRECSAARHKLIPSGNAEPACTLGQPAEQSMRCGTAANSMYCHK